MRIELAELYACVPAAEEEDLLEQLAVEQHEQWLLSEYGVWMDLDPPDPEPGPEELAVDVPEVAPTPAQALGIVQLMLGATVLEEWRSL